MQVCDGTLQRTQLKKKYKIFTLAFVRLLVFLPLQQVSVLFLVVWGVLLSKIYIEKKYYSLELILISSLTNTLFLPLQATANIYELVNATIIYFVSLGTLLWAILSFFPEGVPSVGKWKDTTKPLNWLLVVVTAVALGNICFQIINTITIFMIGSSVTPLTPLSRILFWSFNSPLGLFNVGCCVLAGICWSYCLNENDKPAKSFSLRNLGKCTLATIATISAYMYIANASYQLLQSKGRIVNYIFPNEIWQPELLADTAVTAETVNVNYPLEIGLLGSIEEITYSGVLANLLFKKTRLKSGVVCLILVLSRVSIHLYQGLSPLFTVSVWSLFAAIYCYRSNRLAPLVIAHFFINFFELFSLEGNLYYIHMIDSYILPAITLIGVLSLSVFAKLPKSRLVHETQLSDPHRADI